MTMQDRWAVMNTTGEWGRDAAGKVLTFFAERSADQYRDELNRSPSGERWTTEPFTVEDALEEMAHSPFATEGGL